MEEPEWNGIQGGPLYLSPPQWHQIIRGPRGPIFVRWPRQPNFLLTGSTPLSDAAPRVYDFCAPRSFVQVDRWRNEGPHRSFNSRYTRARNPYPRFGFWSYTGFRNYDDWSWITFFLWNPCWSVASRSVEVPFFLVFFFFDFMICFWFLLFFFSWIWSKVLFCFFFFKQSREKRRSCSWDSVGGGCESKRWGLE